MEEPEITEEMRALRRLLPDETVVTPAGLAVAMGWLVSVMKAELEERPAPVRQKWVRPVEVAQLYGVAKSQAHMWLSRLREMGKVRMQKPISGRAGKGCTYYCLPDIEAAFSNNTITKDGEQEPRGNS